MGLFSCPWFRWGLKHSSAPNVTSCYQLARVESPTPLEEQAEGVPSLTDNGSVCEDKRGSSGLSARLRKRFSKEINAGPKSTDKKARSSFLSFTPKLTSSKPGLLASDGFPSSLMSDRGDDSDVQFMDIPTHANNSSERPYNGPSIWGSVSPLAQPYYETEPDDPGEELAGESSMVVDGPFSGQSEMERPQLPWHPRDYPHWGPVPPITHNADHEHPRKRIGSPYTTGFFDNPGRCSTANRGRLQGYPGRTPISPIPCATSVDSVYGPSSQLSIRKRRQPPPRELKSESHSVHLGSIDISKRLASPSISPRVLSEKSSFDGSGRDKTTGVRSASNQGHNRTKIDTTQAQGQTENVQASNLVASRAKESSSYSRRTSFSSGFSKYQFETKVFSLPESVREPMKNPYADASSLSPSCQSQETAGAIRNIPTAASPCDTNGRAQQSKSPGPCEADPLVAPSRADPQSNAGTAASSSRQVSVGWMSGGRRLGYGYTLIPADDKGNLSPEDTCSLKTCNLNSASTIGEGHDKRSASAVDKPCMEQDNRTGSGKGLPIFEITNMMHRLNLHHWSGATTSSGANNVGEEPSSTSVTSLLWGKFGFLRKSQNEPDPHVDQKAPWSHFCGVGLDHALDGAQTPTRDTVSPVNDIEGQLSKGRMGLHRARSLWTKGRTITDKAHGLETKSPTKIPISTKQNPGLRREKTRVIKFKDRGRKKTISHSLEEKPIFPSPKQHDLSAISRVEESHGPSTGYHERRDGALQVTERSSSDTDLADAYEDCLEVHSLPN
ncbi:hypothetical protein BDV24DRAFT_164548 [Aspergillus arachidicola]|uniref:Uncharacterized protein n=1 Tax=Aspergillus arachidicola TaxID=656916 RepID=A0A5N6Y9I5_9EURO|nr:hypothetical protein BDV24DRAFT_164548 [Aspergillus arachidicola]